ncbi:MAG: GAF domain-containing protein [Chloroflexi bacterium]|nr:MAG: GAF domain-containing protein [Chloroflexota bacterium]
MMMEVEQQCEHLSLTAPAVLTALLNEFSAVTDYRTLRDSLPRRLAHLLNCRCVLLYQRIGETLQFAAGTFDDVPGWSVSLLSVAHINPIDLSSDLPEARAWRSRHAITCPPDRVYVSPRQGSDSAESSHPALVAVPLIYRQRAIGILVAFRSVGVPHSLPSHSAPFTGPTYWSSDDLPVLEAVGGVVALLLENTRLLERDRERIHELSLLNSIASQLNCSMYEPERVHNIILQRTREITSPDHCVLIWPDSLTQASWITPALRDLLLMRFSKQREPHPLIIERPGDSLTIEYLNHLPANIKTFFAVPLLVSEGTLHRHGYGVGKLGGPLKGYPQEVLLQRTAGDKRLHGTHEVVDVHGPKVLGVIVGAYHRAWKLRREELVLLQVLASQASAVLENMHLVTEVVEARNEARKLLRQVLDDQRLKELILESVPSGLITVDLSGCITTFNRAAQAILGYHPYEVLGQPLQKILNLSVPAGRVCSEEGQVAPHTSYSQVNEVDDISTVSEILVTLDRHAQEVVLDVHLVPLYNDLREQIGWLATFADVTSMHRLEEEKRRLDRLASLGEMAASVAHEVRNPLASIKTSMQMLADDLSGFASLDHKQFAPLARKQFAPLARKQDEQNPEAAQESVAVTLKEVERLDAIVRDLLLFARPRQLHCIACNLAELSERVLKIMQAQCAEMGVIIHRVYHDVPVVQVDMAQMEQVLFNLYMNAIQAMPEGGILTVLCQVIPDNTSTYSDTQREQGRLFEFGEPIGAIDVDEYSKSWLELSVSDTGIGIAPDQLERIFQPFFTTKAHGIGLGLPITRRLVEDHRGHLLVESQPGYGTTISVRLPISDMETS